jgi:hypothetical protein
MFEQVLDLNGTNRQRQYAEHYWSLITRAHDRGSIEDYTEQHHVFPKSVCGDNDITVALTPRSEERRVGKECPM